MYVFADKLLNEASFYPGNSQNVHRYICIMRIHIHSRPLMFSLGTNKKNVSNDSFTE